ncbi:MAG TPA: hypothetical protein VKB77_05745 [Terriglobales bacterium]|nr:hypothetical protein [Terriglobales bacterium]
MYTSSVLWLSLLEITLGIGLILWKKPNRRISIRWFTAGILLIVFGTLRLVIW